MRVAFVGKGGSGNKIQGDADTAFLREQAGKALLACFGHEPAMRAMEQGRPFRLDDLGPGASAALTTLQQAADARGKDWPSFTNARAWASAAAGEDLTAQIDPGFVMSPDAFPAATP